MTERGPPILPVFREFILTRHRQIRELEIAGYVEVKADQRMDDRICHVDGQRNCRTSSVGEFWPEAIFAFCPRLGVGGCSAPDRTLVETSTVNECVSSREQRRPGDVT